MGEPKQKTTMKKMTHKQTNKSGYDLYAPCKSFAFHPYNRKKRPPLFWEKSDKGRSDKSHRRIKALLG